MRILGAIGEEPRFEHHETCYFKNFCLNAIAYCLITNNH